MGVGWGCNGRVWVWWDGNVGWWGWWSVLGVGVQWGWGSHFFY